MEQTNRRRPRMQAGQREGLGKPGLIRQYAGMTH